MGVVPDITWGTSRADIDRTVAALAESRVAWARINVSWSGGEPTSKGALNEGYLSDVDYAVARLRAAGIQALMPVSDGVPFWASADPSKSRTTSGTTYNKYWKPLSYLDYADFVRRLVLRYRPLGVSTFEIWNEPNLARFWPSGPNAADYVAMMRATYPVIKAAAPDSTVLMGGLSKSDYTFLEQMYDAGAARYMDAVNVHPYTGAVDPTWCWNEAGTARKAKDALCGLREIRSTMVSRGDAAKPLWVTEFGWSTYTGTYGVSEAKQADYYEKAFALMTGYGDIAVALAYNFRNNYWSNNAQDDMEANYGHLRTDFSPKPSLAVLRKWASASPR